MASFGASNEAQWKGLTDFYYREQADGSVLLHYDLLIAQVVKAQVAGMTAQAVATGEATLWNSLKSLQNPVLVMKGADSDLLSASTVNQMLDCNSLVKAVTIPNCGHAPHLMDAHQVQVVHSFLSEQI
jgi:pimeloyl-ACP methyl ester carboxylesterase